MRPLSTLFVAAIAALSVGLSHAARADPGTPAVAEKAAPASGAVAAESADSYRLRLGVALGGAVGLARHYPATGLAVEAGALNPTVHLDLGLQISPNVSVYAHGEFGTIVLANQAAAYLIGEWSPRRWYAIGAGVGWDGMATWCPDCNERSTWSGVSIPVLVGFDVWQKDHHALRIGAEVAGGFEPETATFGWHGAVTFGWALR
jgi:hypothetical protein